MKKHLLALVVAVVALTPGVALAAPDLDGIWWGKLDSSFKLGWVSGYAKAMDLAGTIQMGTCASNLALYQKEWPNLAQKDIMQKMCLSDTQFDFDGFTMGQFVDGIDAFYKDYRNKQLRSGLGD